MNRAKMIMEKLIDKLNNDKVALIVFAGKPYMQMPMTIDGQSAKMFLNSISTNMVPMQGTAIGAAIDMSAAAFSRNSKAMPRTLKMMPKMLPSAPEKTASRSM